jgi:hypothetical protein
MAQDRTIQVWRGHKPALLDGQITVDDNNPNKFILVLHNPIPIIKDYKASKYEGIFDTEYGYQADFLSKLELGYNTDGTLKKIGMGGASIPETKVLARITFDINDKDCLASLVKLDNALVQLDLKETIEAAQPKVIAILQEALKQLSKDENPKKSIIGVISTTFSKAEKTKLDDYNSKKEFLNNSIEFCKAGKFDQLIFLQLAQDKGFSDSWRQDINTKLNGAMALDVANTKSFTPNKF